MSFCCVKIAMSALLNLAFPTVPGGESSNPKYEGIFLSQDECLNSTVCCSKYPPGMSSVSTLTISDGFSQFWLAGSWHGLKSGLKFDFPPSGTLNLLKTSVPSAAETPPCLIFGHSTHVGYCFHLSQYQAQPVAK